MRYIALTTLSIFILVSSNVFGHGGGLNSSGCHNQSSNNTYHCHRSGGSSGSSDDGANIALGLLLVTGVVFGVYYINKQNPKYSFTPSLVVTDKDIVNTGFQFKYKF